MQTRLGQRMPPVAAVLITATGFGLLHLEWIHALLAFVLGLYLGWITEVAGSALPAIACHVINNALFTMLAALVGTVGGAGPDAALLVTSGGVFVGSGVWLRRFPTGVGLWASTGLSTHGVGDPPRRAELFPGARGPVSYAPPA